MLGVMSSSSKRNIEFEADLEEAYEAISDRDKQIRLLLNHNKRLENYVSRKDQSSPLSVHQERRQLEDVKKYRNQALEARDEIVKLRKIIKMRDLELKDLEEDQKQIKCKRDVQQQLLDGYKRKAMEARKVFANIKQKLKSGLGTQYELEIENQRLRDMIQTFNLNEQQLVGEIKVLSAEYQNIEQRNQAMIDKYNAFKLLFDKQKTYIVDLENERNRLRQKKQEMKVAHKSFEQNRFNETKSFQRKIIEIEKKLSNKSETITKLQRDIKVLKVDNTRKKILELKANLANEKKHVLFFKQKNLQIEQDLDYAYRALKEIKLRYKKDVLSFTKREKKATLFVQMKLKATEKRESELKSKCMHLQMQQKTMEKKISNLAERNQMFEEGYGHNDFVFNQKKKSDYERRENDLKEIRQKIRDELKRNQKTENKCQLLKQKTRVQDYCIEHNIIRRDDQLEGNSIMMLNIELKRKVEKLKIDRLQLLQKIRKNANRLDGVDMNFIGLSNDQLFQLSNFALNLKKGLIQLPLDDQSKDLQSQLVNLKAERAVNLTTIKLLETNLTCISKEAKSKADLDSNCVSDRIQMTFANFDVVREDSSKKYLKASLRKEDSNHQKTLSLSENDDNFRTCSMIPPNYRPSHNFSQSQPDEFSQRVKFSTRNKYILNIQNCVSKIRYQLLQSLIQPLQGENEFREYERRLEVIENHFMRIQRSVTSYAKKYPNFIYPTNDETIKY